ncbi:F protein [Clanis bilineata nucleopolyhedrovirus]|uniref:F protein n=1 Tax=Clanis bilineata nucleopolyhedrovirus TaxID=1307957 RepID=Q4PR58_9ABAC|nr:F protein [Clanis bilineata nucleopolyhedrovirus]AAY59555.1 F protein [Clanis bilineata nucleopolyhedrovirus]
MAINILLPARVIAMVWTVSLVSAITVSRPQDVIDVHPLPHTSGFFYQPINKMQFVEDVWHFIIEMDHGDIFFELNSLYSETNELIRYIDKRPEFKNCSTAKIVRKEIDSFILKRILTLVKHHNDIDDKISHKRDRAPMQLTTDDPFKAVDGGDVRHRAKRGILNFVGTVDKFLFGVMDSNDADELHRLAKTSNALNQQVKELTDEMISISRFIEHKQCVEEQRADLCVYINAKVALILEQINEIDTLYTNLDRAVDDALNNKINSMVMTPERLLKEMTDVTTHVPLKLTWPVPLKLENMHDLINNHIIKTHVFITNDRKLLFVLEIPLINQQTYDVYQVIPIPYCNNDGKCAVIVPDSKYLGVSSNKRNYVRLEDDAPKICKMTTENLLCFAPKIIYDSSQATLCDIKILLKNEDDYTKVHKDCDVRVGKFDTEIFYPISEYNNWLYVLQKDTEITFDCGKDMNISPLIIAAGTGTISGKNVTRPCKLVTKKVELSLHQLKNSLFSVSSVPISTYFNLSAALGDLDKLEIQSLRSNTDLDHKNLQGMTERLIDLRQRMNNNTVFNAQETELSNKEESTFCWLISFTPITCHAAQAFLITMACLTVFLIVYRIYKLLCPGLCSDACTCCCGLLSSRNESSVVKVNNRLHYLNKQPQNEWSVKYVKGKQQDDNNDDYEYDEEYGREEKHPFKPNHQHHKLGIFE